MYSPKFTSAVTGVLDGTNSMFSVTDTAEYSAVSSVDEVECPEVSWVKATLPTTANYRMRGDIGSVIGEAN